MEFEQHEASHLTSELCLDEVCWRIKLSLYNVKGAGQLVGADGAVNRKAAIQL